MYVVGEKYTRKDIYRMLNLPPQEQNGDWLNGYHRHGRDYYVFCNVGLVARTGHDHDNRWDGDVLIWHGKTSSHFGQPTIQNLIGGQYRVLVFFRTRDKAPFEFAGIGRPDPHPGTSRPVRIDWHFDEEATTPRVPDFTDEYELGSDGEFFEGQRKQVLVNRYERDPNARAACLAHYGPVCVACNVNLGDHYGALAEGLIHVHHLVPLSQIGQAYVVDPVRDLVPVCPNCHAVIHRRDPPLEIDEIRGMLERAGYIKDVRA